MPLPTFSMEINKNYFKIYFYLFFFSCISARLSHGLLTHPVFHNTKQSSEFFPCHSKKAKSAKKISYPQPQSVLMGKTCALHLEYSLPSWLLVVLNTLCTDFHSVDNKIKLIYLPSSRIQCYCSWFIKIFINKNSPSRAV